MRRALAMLVLLLVLGGLWRLAGSERRGPSTAARAPVSGAEEVEPPAELVEPARLPGTDAEGASTPRVDEARPTEREPTAPGAAGGSDLVVQVVDPLGKPLAGIPLRLLASQDEPQGPGPVPSDATGRARFDGMRSEIARASEPWSLRAELPFEEPPRLLLDATVLAHTPVAWTLPGGGALDVSVRELDGVPAPKGSTLRVRLVPPEGAPGEPADHEWRFDLVTGAEHLPWVELGRTWELVAFRPNGSAPTRTRTRGPLTVGERVAVELVLGSDHPVVSFRVLDPARRPLADSEIELARGAFLGSVTKTTLTTDARGRFTIDGDSTPFGEASFTVVYRPEGSPALQGSGRTPDELAVGWNDGGDIVLEADPLLCSGRVIDERNAPVADAKVIAGEDRGWMFGDERRIETRSDAQGRFEMRGAWSDQEFPLHAEQDGSASDGRRTRQGETGITLVLAPRFHLSGRLEVDPGVDPKAIHFRIQARDAEPVSIEREREPLFGRHGIPGVHEDPPEAFRLEPVRGGLYALLVELEGFALARLDGLVVNADLDLGTIDLRGRLHVIEIALEGARDPAALGGELSWWPSDGHSHCTARFSGELVTLFSPWLPIDVELRPEGYRVATLQGLTGRSRVTLEPALRVRLVLETDGELPVAPDALCCQLRAGYANVGTAEGNACFTAQDREVVFLVSTPGVLEVCWNLRTSIEGANFGGAWAHDVLEEHRSKIEVLDVPGEQVFRVSLDGAALAELARHPPR